MQDHKFITFKQEDFDVFWANKERIPEAMAVDDAVVIRKSDTFASGAFFAYSSSVLSAREAFMEVASANGLAFWKAHRPRASWVSGRVSERAAILRTSAVALSGPLYGGALFRMRKMQQENGWRRAWPENAPVDPCEALA